jgi:hypothetical protein
MKKILLCFLVVIFFSNSLFASDESYRISLPIEGFHLSLDGYYVENVINAMDEDTLIGFVQTGMFNARRVATFTTTIADEIGRVLKAGLASSPGAVPLLIRINKLEIFEITNSSKENAFAELNISFFRSEGTKKVWMYDAGTMVRQGGLDVTHSHPANILKAIRICFEKFKMNLRGHYSYEKEISAVEINHNPVADPSGYPIFNNKTIPRGLFRTFEDFRDCRPDTAFRFTVKYAENKDTSVHKARLILPDLVSPIDMWGFSDGESIYMKITNKDFYKLFREPGSFSSHVARKDFPDLGMAYISAGILGGLIGVAIVAAVSSASYNPAELGEFRVDFSYGTLVPRKHSVFMDFDPHLDFLLTTASDPKDTVCLFINNEYHVKLARGFFYSVSIPHRNRQIKVEALVQNGTHGEDIIPLNVFYDGLYVVRITRHNGIRIDHMAPDMRKQLMENKREWNTVHRNKGVTGDCNAQ